MTCTKGMLAITMVTSMQAIVIGGCSGHRGGPEDYLEHYVLSSGTVFRHNRYYIAYDLKAGTDRDWIAREIRKYLANEPGALGSYYTGGPLGLSRGEWATILAELHGIPVAETDIFVDQTCIERDKAIASLLCRIKSAGRD